MTLHSATNFVVAELHPQIFKTSTTRDLLQCRLVSRQWKDAATQILLKRSSIKIIFEMAATNDQNFSLKEAPINICDEHQKREDDLKPVSLSGDKTLPNFTRLVTHSIQPGQSSQLPLTSSLPVDHFDFCFKSSEINRNQPQLISFFQAYGPKIRTLTLDNCVDYFVGHPGMPNFILQYTPNLETLHIAETLHSNTKIPASFPKKTSLFALEHLKRIEIEGRPELRESSSPKIFEPTVKILQHLLKISPQLQQVSFKCLPQVKTVAIFEPSHLNLLHVDSLSLRDANMTSGYRQLEKFVQVTTKSDQGVGLQQLSLNSSGWHESPEIRRRGSATLRQILQANLHSLNSIELANYAPLVLHKIQGLPALPSVTKLKISFVLSLDPPLFGVNDPEAEEPDFPGNSLCHLFPNLKTVDCVVWNLDDNDFAKNRFPFWNDRLTGVKNLVMFLKQSGRTDVVGSEASAKAMQLCPNTETFDAHWPYCKFSSLLIPLWISLTEITSLTLSFELDKKLVLDTFVDLDAALTGLSKETVMAIYKNWEECGEWDVPKQCRVDNQEGDKNWLVPRVNSCLLTLKNLRTLTLKFWNEADKTPHIVVSGVSAKFGFDLMKNLQVSVQFSFLGEPSCWSCVVEKTRKEWFNLHKPLLPNVNLQ